MSVAHFLVEGIGKKVLLLLSILVCYFVVLQPILLLDALTGINLVAEPMVFAGRQIDLMVPVGVAAAILSGLVYFLASARLQKAAQESEEIIKLRLGRNSNDKPQS